MVSVYLIVQSSAILLPFSAEPSKPFHYIVDRHHACQPPTGETEDPTIYRYQNIPAVHREKIADNKWWNQPWIIKIASCNYPWENVRVVGCYSSRGEAERIVLANGGNVVGRARDRVEAWEGDNQRVWYWWDVVEVELEKQPLGLGDHVLARV